VGDHAVADLHKEGEIDRQPGCTGYAWVAGMRKTGHELQQGHDGGRSAGMWAGGGAGSSIA
jgi:hypothetical protein